MSRSDRPQVVVVKICEPGLPVRGRKDLKLPGRALGWQPVVVWRGRVVQYGSIHQLRWKAQDEGRTMRWRNPGFRGRQLTTREDES